jgi:hypothetical protein
MARGRVIYFICAGSLCLAISCEASVTARLLPDAEVVNTGGAAGAADNDAGPDVTVHDADAGCAGAAGCGVLTSALYFKGPYDRVEIPANPLLNVPQEFTVEAWVYVESYAGGHSVFNRWSSGLTDIQLTFGAPEQLPPEEFNTTEPFPSHSLAAWVFNSDQRWVSITASSQPSARAWHHLAMSHGDGKLKLYVDGVSVGSAISATPITDTNTAIYIGAAARSERIFDPATGSYWWPPMDGYIAEVRLSSSDRYKTAFTAERHLNPDAVTLGLWHLSEATGSIAYDSGPNQWHGKIVGATWRTPPN